MSLWMPNRLEAVVAYLACSREGLACNPSLHRTYTAAEVAGLLGVLDTRLLVTEAGWGADRVADPVARFGGLPRLRAVRMPEGFPAPGPAPEAPPGDPDAVSYLAFTSGTTGAPKCVMHSDNTWSASRSQDRQCETGPARLDPWRTDQQVAFALRQAEGGTPVPEVCRKMGVSEPTFYRWKQKYGGLMLSEVQRLRQLEGLAGRIADRRTLGFDDSSRI